ncbi:MAG: peptidyl-prolyl cis-trans isomerase [Candidatus Omnitrophica bacterium]|nr:peptidyl-prolyl cis-trans isomerase [Candidatus Omnitrophota bacterium]
MTHVRVGLIIFVCCLLAVPCRAQTAFSQKILAVVNEDAITQTDVDELLAPIYMQYQNTYSGEELKKKLTVAKTDILNQLIEDRLILQQAQKNNLTVDEKEVETLIEDLKTNFKTAQEFDNVLAGQNITLPELRKRYREQLLIKKAVSQQIISKIIISPTEISAYYEAHRQEFMIPEQVRLRCVFLAAGDTNAAEVEKKANDIYEQLSKGTEFVEMVEKYSEAPNVVDAGDMGFVKRSALREEIRENVFNLNPGEITKPIKTASGYYIFKVEEKKTASVSPLSEVQEKIRKTLFNETVKTKLAEWVKKLKESAFIEVKNE